MADIKTARPTEYKEIVYRSKSEAMFARYLELSLADWCIDNSNKYRGSAGFHYEPDYLDVDGWRPDFFVFYTCYPTTTCIEARRREGHLYSAPQTSYAIYEYKPSRPTDEYVREFCTRCDTILSKAYGDYFSFGTVCDIYYGSVFNEVRGVIHADDLSGGDDTEDWLAKYEDKVKATRFDLRHSQ